MIPSENLFLNNVSIWLPLTLATIHPTQGCSCMQVFSINLHFCFASAHRSFLPGDGRGCSAAPHPAQREALEGRVEASSPRCLPSSPRRHRAQHRAFSAQRTCSTKADGQRFPSYHFSPKERMHSYWSPTKYESCEQF